MGNDRTIDNAARVSYGSNEKERTDSEVENLIRYLMRNRHTSPFEMVELLFHLKIPIFVMRQHVRHRTASINEYSGRYSVMSDEFYFPDEERAFGQSATNKQKSEGDIPKIDRDTFFNNLDHQYSSAYFSYRSAIASGVSRELARIQLPLSNYTELYWKINLHNFFHYNGLRDDPAHAQDEIVTLAQTMYDLVVPHVPFSCKAYEDYRKNSLSFSAIELKLLFEMLDDYVISNIPHVVEELVAYTKLPIKGRELAEFENKIKQITNYNKET